MEKEKTPSTLRIIAGTWRGRKINFMANDNLVRPTPDRVRETLFNWLSNHVVGARCLDLYAGSGILSFEALSRKAASVVTVELDKAVCAHILAAKATLQAELTLVQADVEQWLQGQGQGQEFDIIFLDPPYKSQALKKCFQLLQQNHWIKQGTLVYCEHNTQLAPELLPNGWQVLKQQQAGQVHYYLLQV